jgi:hypothetical protein
VQLISKYTHILRNKIAIFRLTGALGSTDDGRFVIGIGKIGSPPGVAIVAIGDTVETWRNGCVTVDPLKTVAVVGTIIEITDPATFVVTEVTFEVVADADTTVRFCDIEEGNFFEFKEATPLLESDAIGALPVEGDTTCPLCDIGLRNVAFVGAGTTGGNLRD